MVIGIDRFFEHNYHIYLNAHAYTYMKVVVQPMLRDRDSPFEGQTFFISPKLENIHIDTLILLTYWLFRTRKHKANRYFRERDMFLRSNLYVTNCIKN